MVALLWSTFGARVQISVVDDANRVLGPNLRA
jgi:hypothetical protein